MNNIPTSYYSPEYNVKGKASEKAQMNMSKSLLKDPVKPNSKILDSWASTSKTTSKKLGKMDYQKYSRHAKRNHK